MSSIGNESELIAELNGPPNRLKDVPEDPEDILSAFLGVVYNYTPITHAEAGSTFHYTHSGLHSISDTLLSDDNYVPCSSPRPISLDLRTPDTRARNWELHASSIWAASVYLADHVQELDLDRFLRYPKRRLEVLELGAGAGLPGLLTAKYLEGVERSLGHSGQGTEGWRVTLSDYPDDLLISTLRENVRQNGYADDRFPSSLAPTQLLRVVPYAWGEDVSPFSPDEGGVDRGYDVVLASDTLWNVALHEVFARTLYQLLRHSPESRAHLVAGLHTGRYALAGFLRTLRSVHIPERDAHEMRLEVLQMNERDVTSDARREWEQDRDGEDDVERRRWIVWIVLGWKTSHSSLRC